MQGKIVVVTGASQGIGAATARVFAMAGAKVALLARQVEKADAIATEFGTAAFAIHCDVAQMGSLDAAMQEVMARWGRVDVWINNAGVITPIGKIANADPLEWGAAIDINLKGVFHGMRAAIPIMRAQGDGTILTVSSGAATNPLEGWSAYCASKAGAAMLTRAAHLEEVAHGLRIMGLSPGTVATDMQIAIKASGVNPVSQLDPSVHIPAEWPAKALLWMCGDAANGYLGQEISLRDDGIRRAIGLVV